VTATPSKTTAHSSSSTPASTTPGGRSGLPAGATVHAVAPSRHTPGTTPIKPPPGLDSAMLNPAAREFQPTDDSRGSSQSPAPVRKGERQWKYGADPATYSYATDPASIAAHAASALSAPAPQQTVTIRMDSIIPPTVAVSAPAASTSFPAPQAGPQVTYKERSPHAPYAEGATQSSAPIVLPTPADYHPATMAGRMRVPGAEGVDIYGQHMPLPHHAAQPQGQAHMGMYHRPAGIVPGAYNMPMAGMGMPVYDPQMMYMHDAVQMGHHHYGDGTVWYNMQQGMHPPSGMTPSGPEPGAVSGGTVYYPLPPAPPASE
jgi:hypothetical protein